MQIPSMPLRFPDHFPPTGGWDKFFLGVRWIGPDLSFFKALKNQQASRSTDMMRVWGGGLRQELAERFSSVLSKAQRWKAAVFLPEDSLQVVCHGPTLDSGDPFALQYVIDDFEEHYRLKVPAWVFRDFEAITVGDFVDRLLPIIARSDVAPGA
jgi:hypothetical protein